jgi:hypothetical protein
MLAIKLAKAEALNQMLDKRSPMGSQLREFMAKEEKAVVIVELEKRIAKLSEIASPLYVNGWEGAIKFLKEIGR